MSLEMVKVLVIVGALAVLAWQVRRLVLARASETWPHTTGRVLDVAIDETRDRGRVKHRAYVRYSYTVDATRHVSTRLTYAGLGVTHQEQLDALRGIVKGREVDVFYDPRRPSRSVLLPGSNEGNFGRIFGALILVAFTVWAAVWR